MKMDLKLDLDMKKWLPRLRQAQPYVFGVALVAVFGYTAWVVDAALNVKPATVAAPVASPKAKVTFDKQTIEAVKKLQVVKGTVPTGELGTNDPFK